MMWTDETPQETMLNMAMHEIKTLTQTVAELRAERERQQDIETILRALAPAARDVLWCALVWNDHNHEYRDLLDKAERAAKSLGFERSWIGSAIPQVNEWMARIDRALASPPAAVDPAEAEKLHQEGVALANIFRQIQPPRDAEEPTK